MWLHFILSCLICIIVLYLPTYFLFRALNADRIKSLLYAPLASITIISIIGIAFDKLDIPANGCTICASLCLLCLPLFFASCVIKKRLNTLQKQDLPSKKFFLILFGYVGFGFIVTTYMYILPMNGPESFVQTYDNVFHYNTVESFIQSGHWSILHVDAYLTSEALEIDPLPGSSFYPAGWHILTALIASIVNVSVPLAANSVNTVLISVAFSTGIFSLLFAIFGNNKLILVTGIFCTMAVSTFPWSLYNQWPLFPNAASLCLAPLIASCFIEGINTLIQNKKIRISVWVAFIFGLFSLTVLQPNSIFTLIIFLVPFCVWQLYLLSKTLKLPHAPFKRLILPGIFLLFVSLLFVAFFNLPFLQSTINYYWPPIMTTSQAILSVLDFSSTTEQQQLSTAFLILIGIIFLAIRGRGHAWLIVSYITASIIFIIAASDENTFLKHFLSGYWYTDPYRISAFLGVFSIPIITFGLASLIDSVRRMGEIRISSDKLKTIINGFSSIVLLALFSFLAFIPASPISNSLNYLKNNAVILNLNEWNYLDSDELEFINKIKSMIPDDALIINQPHDGSMYAYGITGLDLYYRDISGYGAKSETEESKLIRSGLNQMSSNQDIEQAVKAINAEYVLLLKSDFYSQGLYYDTYESDSWIGIESINEDTPGFSLVYEENDMKLFKIE